MLSFSNKYFIYFFILIFGLIFRLYNINFDDYWYDEIISFWVASPAHSLSESIDIHNRIEINTYTYSFLLKYYYQIFGYDADFGRYLSLIFSFASLIISSFFFKDQKTSNAKFLLIFLLSFNIYLISYSQEARVYSILFFFSLCFLLFFKNIIENNENFSDYFFLITLSLFAIILHPFAILILITCIFFLFLKYFFHKTIYLKLNISLLCITLITFLFYYFFITSLKHPNPDHYWIGHPDFKFYTNFFFSNFFGSRIMGLIFLITFIILIVKEFKTLKKLNFETFLILLIILSYFLPILFGYIFKPVLISRYIIFVIFPILMIISTFVFKIKDLKIRYLIILFLCLSTLANHFTEQSLRQFITDRVPSKPEYKKAIKYIYNSNDNKYFIKTERMKSNIDTSNAIRNYINQLGIKNDNNLKFYDLKKNKISNENIWIFCPQDINPRECIPPNFFHSFLVIEDKNFNNINLKLIKVE